MVYKNLNNLVEFTETGNNYEGDTSALTQLESIDFTFTKISDKPQWDGEGSLLYTITLANNITDDLTGIQVIDTLPAEVTFDNTSVEINDEPSSNFEFTAPSTVKFGGFPTLLESTPSVPLVITFRVTKT